MDNISSRVAFGLVGSLLLLAGLFTPLLSIPIVGSLFYMRIGQEAYLLLVLALASFWLVLAQRRRSLLAVASVTLALTLLRLMTTQNGLSKMKAEMAVDLKDNPFAGLAELAASSVHLEWGWVVMIAGSVVLGLSAAIPQSALAQGVDSTQALCHPQTPTQ